MKHPPLPGTFGQRRQDHVPGLRERLCERAIALGVGQIGFNQQDIDADRARMRRPDTRDQLGQARTRPGPATDSLQALVVDGDDDDIIARRMAVQ